jgi:putative hydrolase of the HAD superfamily
LIKGILFDIGDTLIGANALQQTTLRAAAQTLAWITDAESFLQAYAQADAEIEKQNVPDINHLYSDKRILMYTLKLLHWATVETHAEEFVSVYRAELRRHIIPNRELQSVLQDLRDKNINLGIVSNGTTVEQYEQLELMEIKQFFDPIIISQQVKLRKPDPAILMIALQHWQLKPREILVLGDRPDWECLAAARAGMQRGLTTQFADHRDAITDENRPDYIISNFTELLNIV